MIFLRVGIGILLYLLSLGGSFLISGVFAAILVKNNEEDGSINRENILAVASSVLMHICAILVEVIYILIIYYGGYC